MGLFGSQKTKTFQLQAGLRADIRSVIERAPADASQLMRTAAAEPALMALSDRLPVDESVNTIAYCMDPVSSSKGYVALTDSRVVVSQTPDNRPTQLIAVPLSDVSQFTYDSGMAFLTFGPESRRIALGFPGGGWYSQDVCRQIQAAVGKFHSDPYAL